jgi:hypothetical protein
MSRPIPKGFEVKQARVVRKASGYFVMLSHGAYAPSSPKKTGEAFASRVKC